MNLTITGQNVEITKALEDILNEKFLKISKHFDKIIDARFILKIEKNNHIAECKLNISNHEIFCDAKGPDMYAVIDDLIQKTDRQVIKIKEKIKDHHQSEGSERKHNF
jgi:putative sigma-54 modulation protein